MIQLGRFTRTETGYAGKVDTLIFSANLRIEPAKEIASERAPDHRVYAGDAEVGGAWTPEEENGTVLYVKIDDPGLAAPVWARLVPTREGDDFLLIWRRRPGD